MLAAQKVTVVAPPLEPSEPTLAGRKREREEPSVATAEEGAGAAAPQATVSVSAATVELTEESVRVYIASLGGRVTIDALKEVRPQCIIYPFLLIFTATTCVTMNDRHSRPR